VKYLLSSFLLLLIAGSCSTSYITRSWKAKNNSTIDYKKILVLALVNDPDPMVREKMEEHLAGDLKDLGFNAVTSISEFGPTEFENMKEETEVLKELCNKKIEAILTVVLLKKTQERYYTPARAQYSPYMGYPNRFWGYYSRMHEQVYSPVYYEVSNRYFWESNFYDLNNILLLYSAQSQSFDPESSNKLGHEYGLMIVKDMVKKNVLQQQTTKPIKAF